MNDLMATALGSHPYENPLRRRVFVGNYKSSKAHMHARTRRRLEKEGRKAARKWGNRRGRSGKR